MTIIYTSETGFTQEYAQALATSLSLPVLPLSEAIGSLEEGSSIFYLGYLMAGQVTGLKQAKKHFQIVGACAVGIRPDVENMTKVVCNMAAVPQGSGFYLQGGYAPDKLSPGKNKGLKMVFSVLKTLIKTQKNHSPQDEALLRVMDEGGSFVDLAHLAPLQAFLQHTQ